MGVVRTPYNALVTVDILHTDCNSPLPPLLYSGGMANPKAPCCVCGKPAGKYTRPGHPIYCITHGIEAMSRHNRAMANREAELLARSIAAGNATAEQIRNREGPLFDRWVGGMQKFWQSITPDLPDESGTLPLDGQRSP